MGASTGNPYLAGAGIAADVIGSIVGGGGGQEQPLSDLHLVDPLMQQKRAQMIQALMGGGMDTGFGANIKQGTSQLQQMMAQRGIKVGSGGAYTGGLGNMVGTALSNDANERYSRIYQMLGMPIQIASATGKNYIPGSPSSQTPGSLSRGLYNGNNSGLLNKTAGRGNDAMISRFNENSYANG
jgi:hypothetical protein